MKEAFAAVLSGFQGLGADDSCERPVDRLGALGAIGRTLPSLDRQGRQLAQSVNVMRAAALRSLGVDLVAFKFGKRETSQLDAEDALAAVLAWQTFDGKSTWRIKTTGRERLRIAKWAVREWSDDICKPCTGSGLSIDDRGVARGCPACGGMKKHRYSDSERRKALGGHFDRAMAAAHGIIGSAESLAIRGGEEMLEHWSISP